MNANLKRREQNIKEKNLQQRSSMFVQSSCKLIENKLLSARKSIARSWSLIKKCE